MDITRKQITNIEPGKGFGGPMNRFAVKRIGSARPWDWQLLVNGSIDEHAYELGAIDTSLPFAELKSLSHINDRDRAADRDPAFSSRVRHGLPGMP